ncbi:MAG: glycosyltransferase family 2 protein [Bdellovibrionales bacterium]
MTDRYILNRMPDLAIILPFYNEAASARNMFKELYPTLGKINVSCEIICIDDGSSDDTFESLKHERSHDQRIKLVRFARNFGKEAALTCGLRLAQGKAAITMDSDLQHPPEVIPLLLDKWKSGGQLVYAIRRNRDTDSPLRKLFSKAFYATFRHIAEIKLPEGAGDFCLLDRKVIDAVNALPERNRFMKGLVTWVGFRHDTVEFDVAPRANGHTHWNFFRLVRFAFDGLSAFSTFPLRIWIWFGALISFAALAYGAYLTVRTLISGTDVPGYASLMVGMLFLGGVQLLSLGMIGEYLARVFTEVKARPIYLIADRVGFEE